jgi:hypothetical protein
MKKQKPSSVFDRGPQDTAHSEMLRLLDVVQQQATEIAKLRAECFSLAAGQCVNVTADEGGTPKCAEIARLRAAVELALEDLWEATSFFSKKARDRHPRTMDMLRAALTPNKI